MSHEAWKSALALAHGDSKLAYRLVETSERTVLRRLVLDKLGMSEADFWRLVAADIEAP